MASEPYPLPVRQTAERIAAAWLVDHAFCDCAIQQQLIARRILPAVAMFEHEIRLNTLASLNDMAERLAIFLTRAHQDLVKGLHLPGASAAIPPERRGAKDIDPYC